MRVPLTNLVMTLISWDINLFHMALLRHRGVPYSTEYQSGNMQDLFVGTLHDDLVKSWTILGLYFEFG